MPIQFHCAQCGQRLSTPDGSAGKEAKCPKCSSVTTVPADSANAPSKPASQTSATSLSSAHAASFGDAAADPFAQPEPAAAEGANPYLSPGVQSVPSFATAAESAGDLAHNRVDIGLLLSRTWTLFSEQLGVCVLFGLVVMGIQIGVQVVAFVLQIAQQIMMSQEVMAGAIILYVLQQVFGLAANTFVTCILIKFALNLIRGNHSPIGQSFDVGHCFLPILGLNLLLALIATLVVLVIVGPGVGVGVALSIATEEPAFGFVIGGIFIFAAVVVTTIVMLMLYLASFFIVDRRLGVFEAMKTSMQFMSGNKGAVFVTILVTGFLGGLFVLMTCGIGSIFFIPYMALLGVVVYLSATGQFVLTSPPKPGF